MTTESPANPKRLEAAAKGALLLALAAGVPAFLGGAGKSGTVDPRWWSREPGSWRAAGIGAGIGALAGLPLAYRLSRTSDRKAKQDARGI